MECNYDENLNENSFYQALQSEHSVLFHRAILEGWIICVPRAAALHKYTLTDEDFFNHILVPSDELPESHFRSLGDKEVRISNHSLTVESEASHSYPVQILFEETFYNDDMLKFRVICVDHILQAESFRVPDLDFVSILSYQDCVDVISRVCEGSEILKQIDAAVLDFQERNRNLADKSLQEQINLCKNLCCQCIRAVTTRPVMKQKMDVNKYALSHIELAVETYIQHKIYSTLIVSISAWTAVEDAQLNKSIKNSVHLQLKDLGIQSNLYDTIPTAKQKLSRLNIFNTILEKVGCLKDVMGSLSMEHAVCADDFLSVLIFLITKIGIPNWVAHLNFMTHFRFSTTEQNEWGFLIASLEAAIEHVKSGSLTVLNSEVQLEPSNSDSESETGLELLFSHIKLGNVEKVKDFLGSPHASMNAFQNIDNLCHALCSCDKCEKEISKTGMNHILTATSTDSMGSTALHVACKYDQLPIIEHLLEKGANTNVKDFRGFTPLHASTFYGHQNAMLVLLHARAVPDSRDDDKNTPLHLAANNGHEICVKTLLQFSKHIGRPVEVNAKNIYGDTPLHYASRWGFIEIAKLLLDNGARPDVRSNQGISPLDCAHSIHMSKLLSMPSMQLSASKIQNTSSPEVKRISSSNQPSRHASGSGSSQGSSISLDIVPLQEEIKFSPQAKSHKVEKLLKAISCGDIRLACFYMGISDGHISTPKHEVELCHPLCMCESCCSNDSFQPGSEEPCDEATIEEGLISPNTGNDEGVCALHAAATHGRDEIIPILMNSGALINATTIRGYTPLHLAVQHGRTQVVSALLNIPNCDINLQDEKGNTPLHYACLSGNSLVVEMLLKNSPNTTLRNVEGKTPLNEAEGRLALRIIQLLKGNLLVD